MESKTLVTSVVISLIVGAAIGFTYFNKIIDDKNQDLAYLDESLNSLEEQIEARNNQITSLESENRELESTLKLRDEEIETITSMNENTQINKLVSNTTVGGELSEDQIWRGEITITDQILVPKGISLTIMPGTKIKFTHYRGYKEPGKRLGLTVLGTLKAIGEPDNLIWFTSDADEPINGDWGMIRFENASPDCVLMYNVIEFGLQGVNLWKSNITISHSVVRWHNWEGIYLESYCQPLIAYNRIYQNGYNGIAMEQYNDAILIGNTVSESGTNGIHVDASKATIIKCNISNNRAHGLSVDDHGEIISVSNTVQGNGVGYGFGEGNNIFTSVNDLVFSNDLDIPPHSSSVIFEYKPGNGSGFLDYDYDEIGEYSLGYIPGDPNDKYLYVYPDVDETRRVVNKIGEGLGLTWSVAWDGEHIWTAVPWGVVYELDPSDGAILSEFNFPGPQAWGMTYDGVNLWINDFAEKKVYEMDTEGNVLSSFTIPDETGGAKGITWDGEYLYIMGWATPAIFKVDQTGALVETINVGGIGGGLAWDGEYFWAPGARGIAKVDKSGQIVGSIYAASEGTWDLTWDGAYLWATQRTNENWMDAKLYQIEIIDIN